MAKEKHPSEPPPQQPLSETEGEKADSALNAQRPFWLRYINIVKGQDWRRHHWIFWKKDSTALEVIISFVTVGGFIYGAITGISSAYHWLFPEFEPKKVPLSVFKPEVVIQHNINRNVSLGIKVNIDAKPELKKHLQGVRLSYSFDNKQWNEEVFGLQIHPSEINQKSLLERECVWLQFSMPDPDDGREHIPLGQPSCYPLNSADKLKAAYKKEADNAQPWFHCNQGLCYYRGLLTFFPAIHSLHFGSREDNLNRTINFPPIPDGQLANLPALTAAFNRKTIPVLPNGKTYFQVNFFDDTQSSVMTVEDKTENGIAGGVLSPESPYDTTHPTVLAAFDGMNGWSLLPITPPEVSEVLFSTDEGGFFPIRTKSFHVWPHLGLRLSETPISGFIRFQFRYSDGRNSQSFRYRFPTSLTHSANINAFSSIVDGLLICRKFISDDLGLHDTAGKDNFKQLMDINTIRMGLNSSGWGFVDKPGTACAISPNQPLPKIKAALRAIKEIQITYQPKNGIVILTGIADSPLIESALMARDLSKPVHALLPLEADEVYASFILQDGSKTSEIRVRIEAAINRRR